MTPGMLILSSAMIIGLLGLAHLAFTFAGPKLLPRDPAVVDAMKQTSPVLTGETTIWRAWLGFNASHAGGALLFALTFGYLATQEPALFFSSVFLQTLGLATLAFLLALARLYWFRTPLLGIAVALVLYVSAILTEWVTPTT